MLAVVAVARRHGVGDNQSPRPEMRRSTPYRDPGAPLPEPSRGKACCGVDVFDPFAPVLGEPVREERDVHDSATLDLVLHVVVAVGVLSFATVALSRFVPVGVTLFVVVGLVATFWDHVRRLLPQRSATEAPVENLSNTELQAPRHGSRHLRGDRRVEPAAA